MQYYKFVKWEAADIDKVLQGRIPQAMLAYDNGDKQPLKDLHIVTQETAYKVGGWAFRYAEYLRKFWVKTKYYGILEIYALNKTDIRKEYGKEIIKIMEVAE